MVYNEFDKTENGVRVHGTVGSDLMQTGVFADGKSAKNAEFHLRELRILYTRFGNCLHKGDVVRA